ncbi:hypothetical protein G6F22_019013 [Rhizopus arrhizus]|nr:hypothetical protein G6F22_019013 [Rhizopus arrhizus]
MAVAKGTSASLRARRPQSPTGADPLRLRPAAQVAAQVVDGRQHAHAIGQLRFGVGAVAEVLGDGLRHLVQARLQRLAQAAQVGFTLVEGGALSLPRAAQGVQDGGELGRRGGGHGPTIRGAAQRNGSAGRWPAALHLLRASSHYRPAAGTTRQKGRGLHRGP